MATAIIAESGYSYSQLPDSVGKVVRTLASNIKARLKKTAEDIIATGRDLIVVKESLEHGEFGKWLDAEFGWKERTAQNFMRVAEVFKSAKIADLPIRQSALYLLSQPSTSQDARDAAIDRAKKGESVSVAVAKEINEL